MGIIQKQSISNSIITYIGIILGFASTIYLFPRILEPDQYGLTRLMLSIAFVSTQFSHLGCTNIAIKFFPVFQNKEMHHHGFLFLLLSIPLFGFILFVFLYTFLNQLIIKYYEASSPLLVEYYWYVIPLVFAIIYFNILDRFTRALSYSIPGSIVNEIVLRIATIAILGAYFFEIFSFNTFIILFVGSYFLPPFLLLLNLIRIKEFNLKPSFKFLDKLLVKELLRYGLFSLLGGVTTMLVNSIDILMLGSLSNLTSTAVYAVAFYIGSVIVIPQRSVGKIAPTLLAKHLKDNNISEVSKIYKSSSATQLVVGFLLFIGILANMNTLLSILTDSYASAEWVIIIIGISKLVDMAAGVNGSIILNSKYYRFDFYSTLFLVVISIVMNYLLIPPYGIIGAAIATLISLTLNNLIKIIYIWYRYRIQPLSYRVIFLIAYSFLILYLSTQVPVFRLMYIDLFIRSVVITIIYIGGIYYLRISPDINSMLKHTLQKSKNFIGNS